MLTPSYTPNYIKLTIDQVDCMRRKKSLNLCGLSLSVPRWMLREANLAGKRESYLKNKFMIKIK